MKFKPGRTAGLLGGLLALGICLRFWAASGDLWLDEIWSLNLAEDLKGYLEVFAATQSDNNHILNTWWLLLVGTEATPLSMRLPAILSGIFVMFGLFRLGRLMFPTLQNGPVVALLVGAVSYPFVLYGSEARGYGVMVAAFVWLIIFAWQFEKRHGFGRMLLFWVAALVGLLAHGSFVPPFLLAASWLVTRGIKTHQVLRVTVWLSVPVMAMLLLWLSFWSKLPAGTGPLSSVAQQILQVLVVLLGGPEFGAVDPLSGLVWVLVAGAGLIVIFGGLVQRYRADRPGGSFLALLIVGVPLLVWFVIQPRVSAVRYLLPSLIVAQLFWVGNLISWLQTARIRKRIVIWLCLGSLLVANSVRLVELMVSGRGGYAAAVRDIVDASKPMKGEIVIAGDFDFRNAMVVDYYRLRNTPAERNLVYVPAGDPRSREASWYIRNYPAGMSERYVAKQAVIEGRTYEQFRFYPSGSLSGAGWQVLRGR